MATKRKAEHEEPTTSTKKTKTDDKDESRDKNTNGENFRFLLVGRTGSGKSSTGNTILGGQFFTTEASFSSVTEHCQLRSAVRNGANIDVMDCPGLFDTHSTANQEVATSILETLSSMDPGPDVIIYVIEIDRYTEEEFSAYRRLTALMDDVTDHVIIIMTHADRLKKEDVWHKLQQGPPHLQTVLKECDHRVITFDNTRPHGNLSQVNLLLREARKLKQQNKNQPYTLEYDGDLEQEAEERLFRVDKTEARRKVFVKKLTREKNQAEEKLAAERREWTQKSREQEESLSRKEREMGKRKKDLSDRLESQRMSNTILKKKVENLDRKLNEQRRAHARS